MLVRGTEGHCLPKRRQLPSLSLPIAGHLAILERKWRPAACPCPCPLLKCPHSCLLGYTPTSSTNSSLWFSYTTLNYRLPSPHTPSVHLTPAYRGEKAPRERAGWLGPKKNSKSSLLAPPASGHPFWVQSQACGEGRSTVPRPSLHLIPLRAMFHRPP